ncbi:MAG TPA: DUF3794 domain-containing protein [Clostridia bacterium]
MANLTDNLIEIHGVSDMFPACSKAFKQFQIQETLCIPLQKPDMEQILSVHAGIEITRTTVIQTSNGISFEGQILTGKKLIVEGKLHQKIEYVADDKVQSVHAAHFTSPFSSYIVLGEHFNCSLEYEVQGYIEDIYIKQVGKRKMFKNIMILLNAAT